MQAAVSGSHHYRWIAHLVFRRCGLRDLVFNQLWPVLLIVIMPRVKYSLQQKIFTYDYVKKNYKVCRRKFRRKYPGVQIPSKVTIFNLVKKARTEGIFIDKHDKVKRFLTEGKLDDVAYFLQHSVNKSLRRLGQEAGISKASAWRATKLNFEQHIKWRVKFSSSSPFASSSSLFLASR